MLRPHQIVIAVAAVCAFAVSASATAVAAVSAPKGTLTADEYTQLTKQQVALKKFEKDKRATWNQGYAICDKLGQSTKLLSSIRSNCNTAMGIDQALSGFYAQIERCTAFSTTSTTTTPTGSTTTGTTTTGTTTTGATTTGTTTTGTTTTGTTTTGTTGGLGTAQLQLISCLEPEYVVISRAAKSVYESEAELRSQVLARDFMGRCLITLAPRRSDLQVIKRFVTTSAQLAVDVKLISKVFAGTAPASQLNEAQINRDAKAFDRGRGGDR